MQGQQYYPPQQPMNQGSAPILLVDKPTTSWIFGELTTYAPGQPGWREGLAWTQTIIGLWLLSWLIVFLVLATGNADWINNWAGLLVYMLGSAVIVIVIQIGFIIVYNISNNTSAAFHIPSSPTGAPNTHYRNFMGAAHHKELVLGVIASMIAALVTSFMWFDWLCRYKNSCSYDGDSSHTALDISFATPQIIAQYHQFRTTFTILIMVQLIGLFYIIKAMWAHFRPLRAITHLISQGTSLSMSLMLGMIPYETGNGLHYHQEGVRY